MKINNQTDGTVNVDKHELRQLVDAILENRATTRSGAWGAEIDCCRFCYYDDVGTDELKKHALNCPVLVAKQIKESLKDK